MTRDEHEWLTDVDGVLADTAKPVVKEVNRRWGSQLRWQDINSWNWIGEQIEQLTKSKVEGEEATQVWFDPDILFLANPVEGAVEAAYDLMEMGYRLWAATSRLPNARESTIEWLRKYFPFLPQNRIYMRYPGVEDVVSSNDIKLAAVGMVGANLYTEDDPRAVDYVVKGWPGLGLTIAMFNRGWNQILTPEQAYLETYRVRGWKNVVARVRAK
ncbi:hypothetical protein A2397_01490 [Candidatus Amesbacteria bacterium RIFOXYB1_FULL_44_23]|uniref:Uncharacterized protein n=1 Tax=Candidatus Amesbacteria bacterium RIFOXYB1_FULL_44_23 TaxID=1797263 RepID=A0A1F4ZRU9_9BACT|nr:MAG: hypothetical protein A2397_01490 [Candidatus Amesbacteria bacterium RIFOXYB1_FULL_44_23]